MLELRNLSLTMKKNERPLVKSLNFVFNKDDKIALIGEEGNGKTTLLKAIYDLKLVDDYCIVEGQIYKKDVNIGYLEQTLSNEWFNIPISDFFLKNNPSDEIDYDKYTDFFNITSILSELKLSKDLFESEQLIGTLSGGEKVKIQLAKLMINNSDILLLDEPTNDLDIETLEWLTEFINNTDVPILYISHDETLLEETANTIIHFEQMKRKSDAKHNIEGIGYAEYVEKRLGLILKQGQVAKKQRSEHQSKIEQWRKVYQKVDHEQEVISRNDPHGARLLAKKMKTLKSQEKRFAKEESDFVDLPDVEESINLKFDDDIYIPNGKVILDLNIEELNIEGKKLSSNIELKVIGPEHVVIIGKNGVGKTTLFKKIYENLENRSDIKLGYMPQNYEEFMDLNSTALDFLIGDGTAEEITKARTFMGSMKFTSEEMLSKIANLSGGQRAKLFLIKIIISKCNVLLLDEPTRNLSPLSNPIIRDVLANYNGTIISISHDRKFISEVCDKTYELFASGLKKK